jgi:hypothetical protein
VSEDSRRWPALYILCVGMLMIVLDATIVNVALPSIQDEIRVRPLPAYASGPGCEETGMRVVIGCGGCTGSAP